MKPNSPHFDEAKLTAYALNELDATEHAAVEQFLAANPSARRWVEEVQQTATLLTGELKTEECPALTSEQTREIQTKARREKPGTWAWPWFPQLRLTEALALIAIVAVLAVVLLPSLRTEKTEKLNLAVNTTPTPKITAPAPTPIQPPENKNEPASNAQGLKTPAAPLPPQMVAPVEKSLKPAKTKVVLAANNPASQPAESQPTFNYDAVQSAPAIGGAVKDAVQVANQTETSQDAPVNSAWNGGTGTSSGDKSVASAPTSVLAPQVLAPPASGGFGGGRGGGGNYQQNNGSVIGVVNAFAGAGGLRNNGSEGRRGTGTSSISYDYASLDGYESAQPPAEVPTLGDLPVQGRLFSTKNRWQNGTATYPRLVENSFLTVLNHPLSTFSIDVDTASYANVRRFLNSGQRPPPEAVRIEEMINYFHYDYPQPRGNDPFAANIEIAGCPWESSHRLVRIGLKGREIAQAKRPPSNFVFLIDVSGSMQPQERLPLIKQALRQLVKKMTDNDRVAIVVYASEAGIRLRSTSCEQKEIILQAIDELGAGGSTAGAAGIQTAYEVAQENFIRGGVNRVLLCTDGDFNVGMTDQNQLVNLIQDKAKSGVFLTTLGVGTDNYKDALMQKLADKGNGNYAYLDSLEEAQKVLIDQMNGTLITIAKDVKIQVEFNPAQVAAYRLIGYEKRMLRQEDFNNDRKDAGEIGAGHTVTALYEVVPAGGEVRGQVDDLKYQRPADEKPERYVANSSKEMLTLKLRYKQPDGDRSRLLEFPVTDSGKNFNRASVDFQFATAVASFGMLLRDSEFKGEASYRTVLEMAQSAKGTDAEGYRSEFLTLVKAAQRLTGR